MVAIAAQRAHGCDALRALDANQRGAVFRLHSEPGVVQQRVGICEACVDERKSSVVGAVDHAELVGGDALAVRAAHGAHVARRSLNRQRPKRQLRSIRQSDGGGERAIVIDAHERLRAQVGRGAHGVQHAARRIMRRMPEHSPGRANGGLPAQCLWIQRHIQLVCVHHREPLQLKRGVTDAQANQVALERAGGAGHHHTRHIGYVSADLATQRVDIQHRSICSTIVGGVRVGCPCVRKQRECAASRRIAVRAGGLQQRSRRHGAQRQGPGGVVVVQGKNAAQVCALQRKRNHAARKRQRLRRRRGRGRQRRAGGGSGGGLGGDDLRGGALKGA